MSEQRLPESAELVPADFAELLRTRFGTVTTTEKSTRYKMSERHKKKLARIRAKVKELRGNH